MEPAISARPASGWLSRRATRRIFSTGAGIPSTPPGSPVPGSLVADISDEAATRAVLGDRCFDVVLDFIASMDDFQRGSLLGDKAVSVVFDNSKLKRFVPGYRAEIPWREGIRRTLAWFREKPERMKIVAAHNESHDRILAAWKKAGGQARSRESCIRPPGGMGVPFPNLG